MNRTGLIIALAIAVIAGLVFGIYPELDLRIAKYFHDFIDKSLNGNPQYNFANDPANTPRIIGLYRL